MVWDYDRIDMWLSRVRRDPRVTNPAFRLAHALAEYAEESGDVFEEERVFFAAASLPATTGRDGLRVLGTLKWTDYRWTRGGRVYSLLWQEHVTLEPRAIK